MSLPEAVIFDFDGTLIDSAPDICRALNLMLAGRGLAPLSLDRTKRIIGDGVRLLVERALTASGGPTSDSEVQSGVALYNSHYNSMRADPACVLPGVREALHELKTEGVKLGLCTNKPEASTLRMLRQLELRHFFDAVAGGDSMPFRKPDGRHPAYVAARMGVAAVNAVFVGDSVNDIVAARSAGMRMVLMPNGYGAVDSEMPEADVKLDGFAELPAALRGLMEST